ncbi:MAG: NUDIX hydrolase [Patescibacteria group bacterium]|jgi:ADP-ribose pyrophosphatase
MSLFHWKKLSSEIKAENPWWSYRVDRFLGPKSKEVSYHSMEHPGTVVIIGLNAEGKIPLVRQFRPLFDAECTELPAGRIDEGQALLQAARIEFAQEANFAATKLSQIGKFMVAPGCSNAWAFVFLATDLVPANDTPADEMEEFEHMLATPAELDTLIANGTIQDGVSITAWALAKPHILALLDQENATR